MRARFCGKMSGSAANPPACGQDVFMMVGSEITNPDSCRRLCTGKGVQSGSSRSQPYSFDANSEDDLNWNSLPGISAKWRTMLVGLKIGTEPSLCTNHRGSVRFQSRMGMFLVRSVRDAAGPYHPWNSSPPAHSSCCVSVTFLICFTCSEKSCYIPQNPPQNIG